MLHIRCGDDIRESLQEAVPGTFARWADPLCQGPTPAAVDGADWYELRASFIAADYRHEKPAVVHYLQDQDTAIAAWTEHAETVLWFEHDLFDQIILIRLLDWFAGQPRDDRVLSLICIGDHPAIERFRGLGQLGPPQLAALFPERIPVTKDQLELAQRAWAAFRDPDPAAVEIVMNGNTRALPFLGDALRRHLQDFPTTTTGLARTQQLILEAVSEGASDPVEIFTAFQDLEAAPWVGDEMFWPWIEGLASARSPALSIDANPDWPSRSPDLRGIPVRLTRAGHQLFYGELDWVEANGIDRWLGGVHLEGAARWRWDEAKGRLVDGTGA